MDRDHMGKKLVDQKVQVNQNLNLNHLLKRKDRRRINGQRRKSV